MSDDKENTLILQLSSGGPVTIKLRPDNKIVITRVWGDPKSRLNGLYQLTKGLSAIARKARR